MEALGQLSLADRAKAEVQKYVADFLASRKILTDLTKHPSLQIVGKANGLLAVQSSLEKQLSDNLAIIEKAQTSGAYQMSDLLGVGLFASQLYKHINDVKNLKAEADGVAPGWASKIQLMDVSGWAVPVGLGLLGVVLIWMGLRR
jgi:hypothetical protein